MVGPNDRRSSFLGSFQRFMSSSSSSFVVVVVVFVVVGLGRCRSFVVCVLCVKKAGPAKRLILFPIRN
jgi:hypothetical protein